MAASISFLQAVSSGSDLSAYSFAGVSLGTAASDRLVLFGIHSRANANNRTITGVTIAGVTATIIQQRTENDGGNSIVSGLAIAAVPAGTSGTIDVTFSGTMLRCSGSVYRSVGAEAAPHAVASSNATNPTATLDVPAGGGLVGVAALSDASAPTASWSGADEDHETAVETFFTGTSASRNFASASLAHAITCTTSSALSHVAVFASFAPSAGGGVTIPVVRHRRRQLGIS